MEITSSNLQENEYMCRKCGDIWQYCPEDYEGMAGPDICPLCNMPIIDMIKDVYREEGIKEVLRMIWIRIIN